MSGNFRKLFEAFFISSFTAILFILLLHSYSKHLEDSGKSRLLNLLERLDLSLLDIKFKLRGPRQPTNQVAILAVDNESIDKIGRWPWSREVISKLLNNVMSHQPRSVGFDVTFSEKQNDFEKSLSELLSTSSLDSKTQRSLLEQAQARQPDHVLAATLEKYRHQFVLGNFANSYVKFDKPYKDLCLRLALQYSEKYNFSFGKKSSLENQIQSVPPSTQLEKLVEQVFEHLKAFEGPDVDLPRYCSVWLEEQDAYLEIYKERWPSASPNLSIEDFKKSYSSNSFFQFSGMTPNLDLIEASTDRSAFFNVAPDVDGTIRRIPLLFRVDRKLFPSLALQTRLSADNLKAKLHGSSHQSDDKSKSLSLVVSDGKDHPIQEISISADGKAWINYLGAKGRIPYIPAHELLNENQFMTVFQSDSTDGRSGEMKGFQTRKKDFLKDRILLFGVSAIAVYDLRNTPFDAAMPGVELHGQMIDNMLSESWLRSIPSEKIILSILFFIISLLAAFVFTKLNFFSSVVVFASISLGLFFLDYAFFTKGYVINSFLAYLLILSLFILLLSHKYLTEERKKKQLKSIFSKYVSPAVVNEILKHPEKVEMGGEKRNISVFFSDIKGFTSLAENMDPKALSEYLNRYLTSMTEVIFKNKGTLDKYIGDGIMAFFGAPIQYENHAVWACRCALESLSALKELNTILQSAKLPEIEIRIGINSQEVAVGNIGSEMARSYTVLGDGVNLTARLESANKFYNTKVLISENTYLMVKDSFSCRCLDIIKVQGKSIPIKIYEVICEGPLDSITRHKFQLFESAFAAYLKMSWPEAKDLFLKCLELDPSDRVAALYISRVEKLSAEPPPTDWDGSTELDSK